VIPDVPFSSLLTPKQTSPPAVSLVDPTNTKTTIAAAATDSNNGNNEKINNDNTTSKCASQNGSRRSSCSITSANDDFIMVDLMVIDVLNWVCFFKLGKHHEACEINFNLSYRELLSLLRILIVM